jgi:hypothetical protein
MRKAIFVLAFVLLTYVFYAKVLWPLLKNALAVTEQSVVYGPQRYR